MKQKTYTLTIEFKTGWAGAAPLTKKQLKSIARDMQAKLLLNDSESSKAVGLPVGYGQWNGDGGAFYMDSIKVKAI
jgi:hypothetical protein